MELKDIFNAAVSIDDSDARTAYLDQVCGSDDELRREVELLLAADKQSRSPVPTALFAPAVPEDSARWQPGKKIGPYKLLQQLGEGGMGSVFLAEQIEPVQRRVAVKVIKPGMDSSRVIARFEAERQALALMDHENIARVFEAGTTSDDRPYFVMELVEGVAITDYCDQRQLAPAKRLELFVQVCRAIQHAHRKGIIHRDIKPSNVLVAETDGRPVPKVIDFGLAKAMQQPLTARSRFTQYGQIMGTLDYMSPEQASLTSLDIDTRSDVYSLGILLYELLTGSTPLRPSRIRQQAFDQMLKLIREEEPPRPSTRLSQSGDALPSISACRRMDPRKLSQLLRGDLDLIVMKSLEKDRNRRYDSATSLAADVERYLNDDPIEARPPSAMYRLKKAFSKHRVAASVGSLFLLLLVAASAVSTWLAVRARRAEGRATSEAAIAREINQFLLDDLLGQADPAVSPDPDLKVRTILNRAADRIEGRFAGQPLVEAGLRMTLGNTYAALGDYQTAQHHLDRAGELRRQALGNDHPETLRTDASRAELLRLAGKLEPALQMAQHTWQRRRDFLGASHADTLASLANLAAIHQELGQSQEAEPRLLEALELQTRELGPEHPGRLKTMHNLGQLYHALGRHEDAEQTMKEVRELRRHTLGEQHIDTIATTHNLAALYQEIGRYDEAEPLYQQAIAANQATLGEQHPETLKTMGNLASLYYAQGRLADALPLFKKSLEIRRQVLGSEHPETLSAIKNLATVHHLQGDHELAAPLMIEAYEGRRRQLGPDHPQTLESMVGVASMHQSNGDYDKSEELYRQALAMQLETLGENHLSTHVTRNNLAMLLQWRGQFEESQQLYEQALESIRASQGDDHPFTLAAMYNLAELYKVRGNYTAAEPLYLESLERTNNKLGERHPRALVARHRLADLYLRSDRAADAEDQLQALLEIYEAQQRDEGPSYAGFVQALLQLTTSLLRQQRIDEAEQAVDQAISILTDRLPEHWSRYEAFSTLGEVRLNQGRLKEAESRLLEGWEGLLARQEQISTPHRAPCLTAAAERLARLYRSQNEPEKAARWEETARRQQSPAEPGSPD